MMMKGCQVVEVMMKYLDAVDDGMLACLLMTMIKCLHDGDDDALLTSCR